MSKANQSFIFNSFIKNDESFQNIRHTLFKTHLLNK